MTTTDITLPLPAPDGTWEPLTLREPAHWPTPTGPLTARSAYAAVPVAARHDADNVPGAPALIDWESTLGMRQRIWDAGLGVAEAMDTAQRGMGLDWDGAAELITRSAAHARAAGGTIAAGANTDHLPADATPTLTEVIDAYRQQVEVIQHAGARVIVMASRHLAAVATHPEEYARVYESVLADVDRPAILHWLGPMFDPDLTGYWGSEDLDEAHRTVADLIARGADRIEGIKVSLLEARREIALRAELARRAPGVRLYTGDDLNYPELILGDGRHHSDALLGVFAVIYPAASAALQAVQAADDDGARRILEGTVALGRHIFAAPTQSYKAGVAFWSWLNGHQPGFQMLDGMHSARSAAHLIEVFRLADRAGLLLDPPVAAARMAAFLQVAGYRP